MTMPHLSNCPHLPDGWCLPCVRRLNEYAELAGDVAKCLLALVHRDGGHNAEAYGLRESATQAQEVVWLDRIRREDAVKALSDIEQAGHNPADVCPDLVGDPERYAKLVGRLAAIANSALVYDRKQGERSRVNVPKSEAGVVGVRPVPDAGAVRQGRPDAEGVPAGV